MGKLIMGGHAALQRVLLLLAVVLFGCYYQPACAKSAEKERLQRCYQEANELYGRGQFDSAAKCYEQILAAGYYAAPLYYNLGNAYYRLKDYPHAILSYERALKVEPGMADAKFNLQMARNFTVDKLPVEQESPFLAWFRGLPRMLSVRGWGMLALVALVFVLGCVLGLRYFIPRRYWLASGVGVLVLLVVLVVGLSFSQLEYRRVTTQRAAIIMQSVVSVKGAPDAQSKDLFLLHAGAKVQLLAQVGNWCQVSIPDGSQGWLPSDLLEKI